MLCMKCGTKLEDGAIFCAECGTSVGAAAQGNASDDTAEFDSDDPWGDGTVVIEDDTNQRSGAAVAATGIMLAPGMIIVLNGKNCAVEGLIEISGEAAVYKIKMDGKPFILKLYNPGMPLCDTTKAVLFGNYNGQDYEIMEFTERKPSKNNAVHSSAMCDNGSCPYGYDSREGDPKHGIPPGTPFDANWVCPLCGKKEWLIKL